MANLGKLPYPSCMFYVEIDGLTSASFTECSGLEGEVDVESYEEGGVNHFVHKLPGRVRYADLTLRFGMVEGVDLWKWYAKICKGRVERKHISILQYNHAGEEVMRWNVWGAYPIRWSGPELREGQGSAAIESLTLAHQGLEQVTPEKR